jgi:DNA-binding MarR family transcriptional regulator
VEGVVKDEEFVASGPVLDLRRYVPAAMTNLANKLSRGASALYRRNFGVGIIEWRVMAQLAIEPDITASRVCSVIGINKAAVSRSLAFMNGKGLVASRPASDGRQQLLHLTAAGRALHDRIIVVALERERRLLGTLSTAERETLRSLLGRLHENLTDVDAPLDIPPAQPAVRRPARAQRGPR